MTRVQHPQRSDKEPVLALSAAILAGATVRAQGFGSLFRVAATGTTSCALGAACEGAGLVDVAAMGTLPARLGAANTADRTWPLLRAAPPSVLPCRCRAAEVLHTEGADSCDVAGAITHLNDKHRWPRERIAKWVAYLERK